MKIIENHYMRKPTILIHDRIINGCQDFTLNESKDILSEYEVSKEQWKQEFHFTKLQILRQKGWKNSTNKN